MLKAGQDSLLIMASLHSLAADEVKLKHKFGAVPFSIDTLLLAVKTLEMSGKGDGSFVFQFQH